MAETVTGRATTGTYVREGQPSTAFHTGSKTLSYVSNVTDALFWTYVYTNLPANLAGRDVTSAWLDVTMRPGTGSRTLTVQRHAKTTKTYSALTWTSRAGNLAGSSAVAVTQDSADTEWIFDVTADLQAISLGDPFYGWRFTTTYAGVWGMSGWGSAAAVTLYVELDGTPDAPDSLSPDGVTSLAAPVFTWLPVSGLVSAQLQVDEVDGDFSSPLWDSTTTATTIPQLDSDDLGWTGLDEDETVEVRARQTTTGGTSPWSDPVTITRKSLPTLSITSPTGTTEDPSPTVQWTASAQERFQVFMTRPGATPYDSLLQPGDDAAWAIPTGKGATAAGQVMTVRVRVWDDESRSPAEYAEDTVTTTYTPGSATVDTLTAEQDGVNPWVDLEWTDASGPTDEYIVMRDGVHVARFDGLDEESDPVTTYRDYTCPPNTDVVYNVVPVIEGSAGADGPSAAVRMVVTGEWVVDTDSGLYFTTSGEASAIAYTEDSVTYNIPGADHAVTRTFGLHGYNGPGGGALDDYDELTVAEQEAAVYEVKAAPEVTYRYIIGDTNIPAYITTIDGPTLDKDRSFALPAPAPRKIRKRVGFLVTQNGELPFPQVAL